MFDLIDRFFPGDDPKSQKRWRNTVGAVSIVTLLGLSFFGLAATTGIWKLGSLAWAGDIEKKVQDSVKPIEDRLKKVEDAVNQQTDSTNTILAKLTSDQIDLLVKRRCKSRDAEEVEYLSKEIRKQATQYRELTKEDRYRAPTCEEIGFKEAAEAGSN